MATGQEESPAESGARVISGYLRNIILILVEVLKVGGHAALRRVGGNHLVEAQALVYCRFCSAFSLRFN